MEKCFVEDYIHSLKSRLQVIALYRLEDMKGHDSGSPMFVAVACDSGSPMMWRLRDSGSPMFVAVA